MPVEMIGDTLVEHRRVWSRKPVLRRVYQGYFDDVLQRTTRIEPIVEVGCGPGLFKEHYSSAIAVDVEPTPWTDLVADGCWLPFGNNSVGNVVLIDVFHHLSRPKRFLNEVARVLKRGGRLVMLEPWTSTAGYQFYRHVHHEDADRSVDPEHPFADDKAPFDGNAALPELYFTSRDGHPPVGHLDDRLHLVGVERLVAADWLLSGGFRPYGLLPTWMRPAASAFNRLASPLNRWTALRALITLQRPSGE